MLLIEKNRLPADAQAQLSFLREYFAGLAIHTQDADTALNVQLFWPEDASYYIDPQLEAGLRWWDKALSPQDINSQYRREKNYQISLTDNWTLYAWSQWLQKKQHQQPIEEIIVLHIDDHTDCMAPLLQKKDDSWQDMITGQIIRIDNPETVKNAILSGSVSVGSFIAPFFHHINKITLRHLRNSYRSQNSTTKKHLYPSLIYDDLLRPGQFRPALSLEAFGAVGQRSIDYLVTDQLSEWLQDLPKEIPILLHIDMDYFNNRFDGDSDWAERQRILDPTLEQVLSQITTTFTQLWSVVERSQVEDITVALSPGFFPAEFWPASIDLLHNQLTWNQQWQKLTQQ